MVTPARGVPAAAEPRTPTQWKEHGNAHMAAGRVKEAIAAYGTGLEACQSTGGDAEQMRGVLFSNRSYAPISPAETSLRLPIYFLARTPILPVSDPPILPVLGRFFR